jgi:hypothetical protein
MNMKMKVFLGAIAVSLAPAVAQGAVLTNVPMQGGMVMPKVYYTNFDGRIHVSMPPTVPQLTPLLVSNPADCFDPADPWYGALDPSRQGASFSRRYGFLWTGTVPLPEGTEVWIRMLTNTPGLQAYRYRDSVPKACEPVLGTDGVTNAVYWNTEMWHPLFTAPPGTNGHEATMEVYLLDTTTGQEVAGSSSGPLLFHWTNVPDGRPVLTITHDGFVVWPAATTPAWVLEAATDIHATTWTSVTNEPEPVGDQIGVNVDGSGGQRWFRMRHMP